MESLRAFSHGGLHLELLRRHCKWSARLAKAHFCMRWVLAGRHAFLAEARERPRLLERLGHSEQACTFSQVYGLSGSSQM